MADGWTNVPLGAVVSHRKELVQIDDAKEYKRCRVQLHAKGVVLRDIIAGARIKTKSQQVCQVGEFLVAEIDAKVGGYGIVPEDLDGAIVSSHYFLFQVDGKRLLQRFLDYYVRTPTFYNQVRARGSTNYAAIRPAQVLAYKIPLPPPPEQRRIVAKIDRLAEKAKEARLLSEQSRNQRQILVASFKNRLFSEGLARKWRTVPLGSISDIRSGVTLGRKLAGPTISLPYLRVANVQDGFLDLRQIKKVSIRETERQKWVLKPGDLLLTEGGDWDKLGRGTVWRGEIPDCIHQNHIFRVRVETREYDPQYLSALVGSPYGKAYFQTASKKTTNLASINQRQLKAFPVFQVHLTEQRRIVGQIDDFKAEMEGIKKLQAETAAELDALLPSILDKAFKGEL